MKPPSSPSFLHKVLLALAAGMLINACPAWAGPGAHGPNGEHLSADSPTHPDPSLSTQWPRLEAQSETFEVVGQLTTPEDTSKEAAELSLWIDRFDTNEPVLKATVEVASGPIKAQATFHAEHGDYSVTDAALLAQLQKPGTHPLVITIEAGEDVDLLDAKLTTHDVHDHETSPTATWHWKGAKGVLAALLALTGLAAIGMYVARKREGASV